MSTELRDSLAGAMRKVPIDAPADEYADVAVPVVAEWLRGHIAQLSEERQLDRARPDGGDRLYRMDVSMQILAFERLADTLAPALTDTQETDR